MTTSTHNWIGIDLGTCNSSAAIRRANGQIELVKQDEGQIQSFLLTSERCKEFPSFIHFDAEGAIDGVGMASKAKVLAEPDKVVWGVKRLLGKTYTELKESGELERYPYRIRPDRKNGQCLIQVGARSYTPQELCTEIFRTIKAAAERQLGDEVVSAVVSVPAYFDPLRVSPIVEAARSAGFKRVQTIPEPVAAALAHDIEITTRPIKTVVFDLGAGTLDVTAGYLYRQPNGESGFKFQVVKNTGNARLGGMDMDDRMLKLILERYRLSSLEPAELAGLRRSAEQAKIRLSEETQIDHRFTLRGEEHSCRLNQLDLQSALEGAPGEPNLLEECRYQVMAAIDGAGWTPQDVECLLLIGGPTRLPCVQDVLRIVFNSNPMVLQQIDEFALGREHIDRMTAVAQGAVNSIDRKLDDKVPAGYGFEDLEINGEEMVHRSRILIPPDTGYPFMSKMHFIEWTNLRGLFEFKILQQVPDSEIKQFGYKYKFVGIQKLAIRNPGFCMIGIQMGYNENKELIVTIASLPGKPATYRGMVQSAAIGMNYPLRVKRPPDMEEHHVEKLPPSPELLERFAHWAEVTTGYIRRRLENFPVQEMKLQQGIDEIAQLLKKGDARSRYETLYTQLNTLIWNSHSGGILSQSEYIELTNHLAEYEGELFKITISKNT